MLCWKTKTLRLESYGTGYNARFIQLAGEINSDMPRYWVNKVADALNAVGKPVKGSRVLGVAYPANDMRDCASRTLTTCGSRQP